MPITLVNESILNSYHQIVVCPYREERVFEYEDIDKLIDSIDCISYLRKQFYKRMYRERYNKILKPTYEKLIK